MVTAVLFESNSGIMSQLISLGAITKMTDEYVYPKIANKHDHYVCPDCNQDLILVRGSKIRDHFRHKTNKANPCKYYDAPNESQIHKDAKMLMKTLLENGTTLQFMRTCPSCKKRYEIPLPKIKPESTIALEHRFDHECSTRIADVAHICNADEIEAIYEICHTHHTSKEDRPEPWVEIDAKSLLTSVNTTTNRAFVVSCIRREDCVNCAICHHCHHLPPYTSKVMYYGDGVYGECLFC
jgi:hypothetical protein